MPASEAYKKWAKEKTVMYSLRFQRSTDADIIEFLSDKPRQATIKEALREYMKNHAEVPSAVQPTEEEDDGVEEYLRILEEKNKQ